MEQVLSYLGIGLGVAALAYAYIANREKKKIERIILIHLQRLAGNIKSIGGNTNWAWWHFGKVLDNINSVNQQENSAIILQSLQRGMGNITAADQMISNLLNEVIGIQQSLFETTKVVYPETDNKNAANKTN